MKAKPTIKELINFVVPRVAPMWDDVAMGLNIKVPQLHLIAKDNANDSQRCCIEMFCDWLDSRHDASWQNLIYALKDVQLNCVATDVEMLLGNLCNYRCYLGVCLSCVSVSHFKHTNTDTHNTLVLREKLFISVLKISQFIQQ